MFLFTILRKLSKMNSIGGVDMLLEFKVKNYKSFKNEAVLSLIPAPKQKDIEYSVLKKTIGKVKFKALSTSVLYGPNASGKTNIITALDTLMNIINKGNIKDDAKFNVLNIASKALFYIPNYELKEKTPVEFYLSFIKDDKHIEYYLHLDLGMFFEVTAKRKVIYEELIINSKSVFIRRDTIEALVNKDTSIDKVQEMLTKNLNDDELFLSNGFKNIIDSHLFNLIDEFLNKDLMVICKANFLNVTPEPDGKIGLVHYKEFSEVANEIGAINSEFGFYTRDPKAPSVLTTIIKTQDKLSPLVIPSETIESFGTIRFLNLYPLIKKTLNNGGVLIVDEFDASIHPMVLLDIVNIFHNDEININNAQLIFNTHNPVFLSSSILRRDEIKFVEKDEENGSTIYSLADFQTSGPSGVRKTDDYMKHYFISKYGAILDTKLSKFFKPKVENEKRV